MLELIVPIAGILFAARRLLRYLRFFQQEEYNNARFAVWLKEKNAYDTKAFRLCAAAAAVCFIAGLISEALLLWATAIFGVALVALGLSEEDPRRSGKLRLNMTERATRIYRVALELSALLSLVSLLIAIAFPKLMLIPLLWGAQLLLARFAPEFLVAANRLLAPGEQQIQDAFLDAARKKFRASRPYTVGITGSYGKTSTKSILGQVLETSLGPTFWPPKGINTIMGITRDIRERLVPGYPYAVLEIGAYGIGSIERVCRSFPIDAAIVTAVGIMHLDRFGSAENIYTAKSELARAVPEKGILVCNGDNAGSRRMAEQYKRQTTLLYGLDTSLGGLDCWAEDIKTVAEGSEFTVHYGGKRYPVRTPLVGTAAVSNILASFTMAMALGADPLTVVAALANLEPVENRLERTKAGGATYLRDAYNSNPVGFQTALDVLGAHPGTRKILMTPGMIELGPEQHTENRRLAESAAKVCDLALIVGETNRAALVDGLKSGGMAPEKIKTFAGREAALQELKALQSDGDVILIENDLPDLYEVDARF